MHRPEWVSKDDGQVLNSFLSIYFKLQEQPMPFLHASTNISSALRAIIAAAPLIVLAACSGESAAPEEAASEQASAPAKNSGLPEGMVLIPGGTYLMGSTTGMPHETPVHEIVVDPFYLDIHEVTNDEFAAFVEATGFVSEAEEWGWSLGFVPDAETTESVPGAEWWVKVDKADWRHPLGPDTSIEGKGNYPVVQVSWNDAVAYCKWAGKRLPTEAEWEFAARGGRSDTIFPWGNKLEVDGRMMANTWNGIFPQADSGADGYASVSPVETYPANGYGLYDVGGNVWEWCEDWFQGDYYHRSPRENPRGPAQGIEKVLRGGSWLCEPNYCHGYRVSHRNHSGIDTGLNHVGFRCAQDSAAQP